MSFYGTSFYELKQYFKRFLFQNGTDEPITFEPSDIFDGLKQRSDYWIRFDKGEEELPDGTSADILLISHNIPNKEDVETGGLRFYQHLEDAYETELDKKLSVFFASRYHNKIVDLINKYKKEIAVGHTFADEQLDIYNELLMKDVGIDLTTPENAELITSYYVDYFEVVYDTDNSNVYPKGPYKFFTNDKIIQYALEFLNPGVVATIPDFDIDKKGHMVFRGNKVFTFPDNVIGFVDPNTKEVIKVSPNDAIEGDGSYVLFEGNDYIEFIFNEQTGALQIKHKKGYNGDGVGRQSAIPKYYNNIQQVIDALTQEEIKDPEGNSYTIDTFKEKIQSYRSGNILQIPNFSYDEYGHMIQDQDDPYSYLRLDMADSYQIVNFIIKFDEGWELVGDEEGTENDDTDLMELSIYKKRVPELMPYISSLETVFNVACDNKTRLKLIQAGVNEFWIDNVQGEPIMFVRGDSSVFNTGSEALFAFQTQVVSSYESASATEGINGAVIVTLGYADYENYEEPGLCNHTYEEIISYLEMGKMVLCYDVTTKQYYVPYGEGFNHKIWGDYIGFSSITNKDDNDEPGSGKDDGAVPSKSWITSTKIIIPSTSKLSEEGILADVKGTQQFYIKIVDYNLGAKINDFINATKDFINNGQEAINNFNTNSNNELTKFINNGQEAINNFNTNSNNELTKFINNGQEAINNFNTEGSNMIQYYTNNIDQIIIDKVAEKVAPLYITSVELATLQQIKDGVKVGADIYYQNENGINIPLSGLSNNQAIFSINTITNGVLTIQTYTINSIGELTTQTHEVATSRMLPTGGTVGQMLMINANGIPEWTSFLRIDTNDDNLIEYNNNGTWEPVSASWA